MVSVMRTERMRTQLGDRLNHGVPMNAPSALERFEWAASLMA